MSLRTHHKMADNTDADMLALRQQVEELLEWKRQEMSRQEQVANDRTTSNPPVSGGDELRGDDIDSEGLSRMLSSTDFSKAVRVEARKLRENPHTLHQVTTWVCFEQPHPPEKPQQHQHAAASWYLLGSFAVVLLQTVVMWGVFAGTAWPSCLDNSDCPQGDYCPESDEVCTRCLEQDLTPKFTNDRNASRFCANIHDDSVFMEEQVDGTSACETCWSGSDDWSAIGRSYQGTMQHNAKLMRGCDWLALVLASLSVGLKIASEIRDIVLCQLLVEQKLQQQAEKSQLPVPWQEPRCAALFALAAVRRFGLLPLMVATVPYLVLWRGSAALDICFNVVAVLFMLDIDNEIYEFWIPERTRREMEEDDDRIQIDVNEGEGKLLSVIKQAHAALVTLSVVAAVAIGGLATGNRWLVGVWAVVAFWFAAIIEVVCRVSSRSGAVKVRKSQNLDQELFGSTDHSGDSSGDGLNRDPLWHTCVTVAWEAVLGLVWALAVNRFMFVAGLMY